MVEMQSALGMLVDFEWYDALTGGNLVFAGDTFNTGTINNGGTTDITRTYYLQGKDTAGCASVRIPVVLVIRPQLDIPLVDPLVATVCNGQSATFTASSLLTANPEFYWYDALNGGNLLAVGDTFTTDTINNATALSITRTFYVEVRDTVSGCTSIRTPAIVTILPALDVPLVVPPVQTVCNGTNATLTASSLLGNVDFEWYDALLGGNLLFSGNPFTTDTLINANATNLTRTFYVQVRDTAGCASLRTPAQIIITPALDLPLVVPPTQLICSGDSASFEAQAALGLGGNIQFRWYDAAFGGNKLFDGNPYNTGPIINANGVQLTRTYYVELYDSSGCTSLRTPAIVIVQPALDVPLVNPPLATICSNDTVEFVASSLLMGSLTFYWYDTLNATVPVFVGDTFAATNSNASTANLIKTFYVEGEASNGCRTIRTPAVLVTRPLLDVPIVQPVTPICGGFSDTLIANSPITSNETYWYDALIGGNLLAVGDTFVTPRLYTTTLYYVSLKDSSGCESARTLVAVPVLSNLDQPAVVFDKQAYCKDERVSAMASSIANTTYNWYSDSTLNMLVFSGNTFQFTAQSFPTLYVEGVNAGGCLSLPTKAKPNILPGIDAENVKAICASSTPTQVTVQWASLASAKSYSISVDTAKTYIDLGTDTSYTYTRKFNSEFSIRFLISSFAKDTCANILRADTSITCRFGVDPPVNQECVIDNAITPNDDGMNDFWKICPEILTYTDVKVSIFDRWGKEVFDTNNYNIDSPSTRFPKSSVSVVDGTYFYILEVPSQGIKKTGYIMIIR
jgi:gliding motility-associated-like protein